MTQIQFGPFSTTELNIKKNKPGEIMDLPLLSYFKVA